MKTSNSARSSLWPFVTLLCVSFIAVVSLSRASGDGPAVPVAQRVGREAAPATARAPGAGATVNPMDYGAVGDGIADDTTAIKRAIAALPAGDGEFAIPAPAASYRITSTISLSSRTRLTFRGHGSKAASFTWGGAPGGTMFSFSGIDNCVFENLYFEGGTQAAIGVDIFGVLGDGCQNNEFRNCDFQNFTASGVRIGENNYQCDQLTFRKCQFAGEASIHAQIGGANTLHGDFEYCSFIGGGVAVGHGEKFNQGSFSVYHSFASLHSVACFKVAGGLISPINLVNCYSEASNKFLGSSPKSSVNAAA